ncbi:MAG: hypothetical protein LBI33_13495 [Propionibacteriaceae bacterium]|jgi:hypothetical protein|nr:hypothetical protein [Propionibacteriaceae bacterium]
MKTSHHHGTTLDEDGGRRWLTGRLAGHPAWVIIITFLAAAVVTVVILVINDRFTLTDSVATLATLWALFFGVVIYLLSAQDTGTILQEIADLQEQLSTALASPLAAEGIADGTTATDGTSAADGTTVTGGPTDAEGTLATPSVTQPPPAQTPAAVAPLPDAPSNTPRPGVAGPEPPAPSTGRRPGHPGRPDRLAVDNGRWSLGQVLATTEDITQGVPPQFLAGWSRATGLTPSVLTLAWTRDASRGQWVLEAGGDRWLAFDRRNRGVAVMPLGNH